MDGRDGEVPPGGPPPREPRARLASRREALGAVLGALGAAACASLPGGDERVRIATLDQLPPGAGLPTRYGDDRRVLLLNLDGRVRAFSGECTHEGCPVGWNAVLRVIRCPCHSGTYDVDGRVLSGPPPRPLAELRAVVEEGVVYLLPTHTR